jgi:hypothetical protein
MQRSTIVLGGAVAVLFVLTGGLVLSNLQLTARLAAVEATARAIAQAPAAGAEMVAVALDEAWTRKTAQLRAEEVQTYRRLAEEKITNEVDDLAEEYDLTGDQMDRTIELLLDGIEAGHALREGIKSGELSLREAEEEGEELKLGYAASLTEVLGAEAYEALGRQFYGPGGWADAP